MNSHPSSCHPETLMLSHGYEPKWSENSLKPPLFLTSTFIFPTAEQGKHDFELAYNLVPSKPSEIPDLIYSRINNPNLEILENRLCVWDGTEKGLVFASGMAAISTSVMALLRPGEAIIASDPVYGGTHALLNALMPKYGVKTFWVKAGGGREEWEQASKQAKSEGKKIKLIYCESPANPSIILTDLKMLNEIRSGLEKEEGSKIYFAVDNTFLGPCFQKPSEFGADLILYSATKFIGGHSDLIGGLTTGSKVVIDQISIFRSIFGTMGNPFDSWLMIRSLETLKIRMEAQANSAIKVANFLEKHGKIKNVTHPSLFKVGSEQYRIFKEQCKNVGSLICFDLMDDRQEMAFRFLNSLKICKLAVSLGSTETLIQHPKTMTHSDFPPERLSELGIFNSTIRISIGLENVDDIIQDLKTGLGKLDEMRN